jgi:hypothetical protein
MFDARHVVRYGFLAFAVMVMVGLAAPCQAQTGAVHIEVAKAGFIFGVGGGRGTLLYQGRRYPLSIGGISVGATIGASKTELVGRAYNLRQPSDIAGTYAAVGGGVAIAGGGASVRLQNAKGVILDLRGRKIGLEFAANLSGVEISLR